MRIAGKGGVQTDYLSLEIKQFENFFILKYCGSYNHYYINTHQNKFNIDF